jgi:hypothetical protein
MVTRNEARIRAVRLIKDYGPIAEDLDRLFLWLRQQPMVRLSIRDVGDFVAHSDERNRGLALSHARALYDTNSYHYNMQNDLPVSRDELIDQMRAAQLLGPPDILRERVNLSSDEARDVLATIIPKLETNPDGELQFRPQLSERERNLYDYYRGLLAWRPAYDEDSLIDDFVFVLRHHGLVEEDEEDALRQQGGFLAMYVLTRMHLAVLDFGANKQKIKLHVGLQFKQFGIRYLAIYMAIPLPAHAPTHTHLQPLFETHCIAFEPNVDGLAMLMLDEVNPILFHPVVLQGDKKIGVLIDF